MDGDDDNKEKDDDKEPGEEDRGDSSDQAECLEGLRIAVDDDVDGELVDVDVGDVVNDDNEENDP